MRRIHASLLFSVATTAEAFSVPSISMASPILDSSKDAMMEFISRAEKQHEYEFQAGEKLFGISASKNSQHNAYSKNLTDDDFIAYSVSKGNGGPSESVLTNGNFVFETKDAIIDDSMCDFFIRVARETIEKEKFTKQEQSSLGDEARRVDKDWRRTNSDLGEARLSQLPPEALEKLSSLLKEQFYPILTDRFNMEDLTVYDGLILGSIAPSRSQPVHRDASLLTLNIALSSPHEFDGGGTYVEGLENHNGLPLRIERGKLLCHSSGIMHAGTAITSGERWVMVLFVIAKHEAQIARRTHAEGLELLESNSLTEAKHAFEAGLSAAPNDHILHMGIGQIAHMRGQEHEALDRLTKASKLYPASHKAAMSAAKMIEAKRRPRAALRRFEKVLKYIDGMDLLDGTWMPMKAVAWDARVSAGRCALLCAELESTKGKWTDRERLWSQRHLPIAIERFRTALMAAPGDGYINSMLERAEELLMEASSSHNQE